MGKTTELFKKITDTKGTFLAKTGTINHRNGKDLTEESKKKCKEYTELYKKGLNDLDNHDGVITYLQRVECEVHTHTHFLECEVKQALRNITTTKASRGDEIPAELFQVLKDDVKVLHSICQQIWKTQQWPQD